MPFDKDTFSCKKSTREFLMRDSQYVAQSRQIDQAIEEQNKVCLNCNGPDATWVSVNNGIYICINCSGKHRGYGVQISFVRSLEYDNLTDKELVKLRKGGNKQFSEFIKLYQLEDMPIDELFITKACDFYRQRLEETVINNSKLVISENMFNSLPLQIGKAFIFTDSVVKQRRATFTTIMIPQKKIQKTWY